MSCNGASRESQRSFNGVSTEHPQLFSCIMDNLARMDRRYSTKNLSAAWIAKILVTISRPLPTIERLQCVNCVCGGSERNTAINCNVLFPKGVLPGQSLQYVLVFNFTNMHVMSYWSEFFNVAVESICKKLESAFQYRFFRQSLNSYYTAWKHPLPGRIRNLWTPHRSRLSSPPKINLLLFAIWATLLFISSLMLGGVQWI